MLAAELWRNWTLPRNFTLLQADSEFLWGTERTGTTGIAVVWYRLVK